MRKSLKMPSNLKKNGLKKIKKLILKHFKKDLKKFKSNNLFAFIFKLFTNIFFIRTYSNKFKNINLCNFNYFIIL